ncbi:rhodanese-like domain-containing protein [Sansalvadorimonas sp. 2012CJ34-2]|uniref:Rhodanese-like domain-containing protein n=1 Tax=Parendozoicomonas callyspongiae TaxID=2942213 RepID=A0ABT0PLJ8_9GAMM|nr:rhodanese-like domain-containing protein [Sansalvadorimonas sp. 2012CJ34-2]MCL6271856.1 rhodanese-like domain-containing protein [Sansalvadorimonas sp. 2012CJ34-2]
MFRILFRLMPAVFLALSFTAKAADQNVFIKTLTASEVASHLKQQDWVIVDTRLNDAFNGWKLDGVKRGGHIPGAEDFSANWLKVKKDSLQDDLKLALQTKGIAKDRNIVLYDANGKDAEAVADYLYKQGYHNLYRFDINKWADDSKRPLEKFTRYQDIVPAVVVKDILDGKRPETFENAETIKMVEASWGPEKASYGKGHIPTSFHVNTDIIEPPTETKPTMWMLADDEALTQFALDFGFTKNDTVVVSSEEDMAAYRMAMVLKYLGVKDVRILNGGTLAWTMAGYELEKKSHKPTPVKDFGAPTPANPEVFTTMEYVKNNVGKNDNFVLVDNRTMDEHLGKITGYTYHDKKGRIPGSVFGYAGTSGSYGMEFFRNPDNTMRNPSEFLELWKEQGIDTSKKLAFMCGSGWRAAEIYYYADVAGLKDISVYSDGWIGWSNAGLPSETGPVIK